MRNHKLVNVLIGFLLAGAGAGGCTENKPTPVQSTQLSAGYQALEQKQAQTAIDRADDYLRKQPSGPGSAEAFYLKGRGYEIKPAKDAEQLHENLDAARTAYEEALNQNPSTQLEGNIRAGLSQVAYFMDDYPIALSEASKAYKLSLSPDVRSVLLYRMGVSQQRMGRFTDADATFAQVQQWYPGTLSAQQAQKHEGVRNFYVQLATFNSPAGADRQMEALKSSGLVLSKKSDANGRTVVDAGPYPTYESAKGMKEKLAGEFPDALIKP